MRPNYLLFLFTLSSATISAPQALKDEAKSVTTDLDQKVNNLNTATEIQETSISNIEPNHEYDKEEDERCKYLYTLCPRLKIIRKMFKKDQWIFLTHVLLQFVPEVCAILGAAFATKIYHLGEWGGAYPCSTRRIPWDKLLVIFIFYIISYLISGYLVHRQKLVKYNLSEMTELTIIISVTRFSNFICAKIASTQDSLADYVTLSTLALLFLCFSQNLLNIFLIETNELDAKDTHNSTWNKLLANFEDFLEKNKLKKYWQASVITLIGSLPIFGGWIGADIAARINNHSFADYMPSICIRMQPSSAWTYYSLSSMMNFIVFLILYTFYSKYHTKAKMEAEGGYLECQCLLFAKQMLFLIVSENVGYILENYLVALIMNTLAQAFIQNIPLIHKIQTKSNGLKQKAKERVQKLKHCMDDHVKAHSVHLPKALHMGTSHTGNSM